ncbi:MAG: hypothetical protein HC872_04690 [Gammaproteobacteria bacterium]|nr:hypothetical protein [Gammaproteobacteria bacterium]
MPTPGIVVLRTAALVGLVLQVAACSSSRDEQPVTPNVAPTIAMISDRSLNQDTTDAGLSFTVTDDDGSVGALRLSVGSSNEALLPARGLVLGGTGGNRTLAITPAEGAVGTASVSIRATDAQGLTATRTFGVTINPVLVSFTAFTNDAFGLSENDAPLPLFGVTLDGDADQLDAPFANLLQ